MPALSDGRDWREAAASLGVDPRTLCHASALLLTAHRLTLVGNRRAAEGAYRELLRLEPGHRVALVNLISLLQVQGRHAEADTFRRRLIEMDVDALGLPDDQRGQLLEFRLASASLGARPERAPASHVARSFDDYADEYDGHLSRDLHYRGPELVHDAVSRALGRPANDLDVLDLGCGTGLAAPLFRPSARRLDGVDLSAGMLDKARERGLYDHLDVGDLTVLPRREPGAYDLVLAVDVLNYLGDLERAFSAATTALRPGGLFAFTVERGDGSGYALGASGRFRHALDYIGEEAAGAGFERVSAEEAVLRTEQGLPVAGQVIVLRKPPNAR